MVLLLAKRKDAHDVLEKITVGHIPAGSGNGLAKTLSQMGNENFSIQNCAYMIVKGKSMLMDAFEVEFLKDNKKVYAFHSFNYGLVTDVNINSEVCRWCGDLRYTFYGVYNILCCFCFTSYYGKTSYLPKDKEFNEDINNISPLSERKPLSDNFVNISGKMTFIWGMNIPWQTREIHGLDEIKLDDGYMDLFVNKGGKYEMMKLLSKKKFG